MSSEPLVLIVDDDAGIRSTVERFARRLEFDVVASPDGTDALKAIETVRPDVALLDLHMPGLGGLEVLRTIRERAPDCQAILMTGQPTVDTAIEALKLGALDYLSKPFELERLGEILNAIKDDLARRRDLLDTEANWAVRAEVGGMIGRSPAMQELFSKIRRFAPHVRTALVTGETGTGKELVARALHDLGPRRTRPFVACNCSAVAETLFESEFFGHTRGAFTGATEAKAGLFESADGGTLFLDEVGELPLQMQAKLLRVLEYGEVQRVGAVAPRKVDVRVIAATNRNLSDEVRLGRFREDLYYRLNLVELHLPSLRDRREDIAYLTAAFVKEFAKRFQKPLTGISAGAERLLHNAPWPGNVRELRNALERACMLCDAPLLGERDMLEALSPNTRLPGESVQSTREQKVPPLRPIVDRHQVERALQECGGNRAAAARRLGLSRRAFYRRLEEFGVS